MIWGRPAAAADNVQPAVPRPSLELRGKAFRRLGKTGRRQRIGQPGVRIRAYVSVGAMRELFDVRLHLAGPERAVQSHHERIRVGDRRQKRFDRLPAQDSPGAIGHRSGNDKRNSPAQFFEQFGNGRDRCFCIQGVENSFDHQQIYAALQQSGSLFAVAFSNLIERDRAKTGIVYIGRQRSRDWQWAERTADETPASCLVRDRVRRMTRHAGRVEIDLRHQVAILPVVHDALEKLGVFASAVRLALKKKVMKTDGRAAEGVGFDDVRAGFEITPVDFVDEIGFREEQDLETALEVFSFPILEAVAAITGFAEFVLLDHRPHGPVEHDDALAHERFERMESIGRHGEPELNRSSPCTARNKLTHHDA